MSIVSCPNCGMQVLPKFDGTCPSCQAVILQPENGSISASEPMPNAAQPTSQVDENVCGKCGNANEPVDRFCRACGAPLSIQSAGVKAGQRKIEKPLLQIERDNLPFGRAINFQVFLDSQKIGEIGNGKEKEYILPEGKHLVYVKVWQKSSNGLRFEIKEGQCLHLICGFVDPTNIYIGTEKVSRTIQQQEMLEKSTSMASTRNSDQEIINICGLCGGGGLFLFNMITGIMPGIAGYWLSGAIGGGLGAALGMGINSLRRKKS